MTLVLWSFYSPDAGAIAAELAAVRAAAPGPAGSLVLHVAGGVHATAEPQHVLDYGWDLAAIGEGEATMLALVPALRDGAELTRGAGPRGPRRRRVALRTPQAPQLPPGAVPSFPSGRLRADGSPSPAPEPGRAQRKPATISGMRVHQTWSSAEYMIGRPASWLKKRVPD